MTAPTIPAPAASEAPVAPAVPAAPVVPAAPKGPKRAADILTGSSDELLARFGLNEQIEGETPAPPAAETPAPKAEQVAASPEAAAPAAEAPKPETPPRPLATQFKVFSKDGEAEIPEVEIVFTANGKERREPLDKVVRLAQSGYYNEEREQTVVRQRAEHQQLSSENTELKSYVEALRNDVKALVSDPSDTAYKNLKAAYERQNTPEARAERAERALAEERQRGTGQAVQQQAAAFSNVLNQHLTQLTEQHPEVSFHEILGRFNELTLPYMRAGQVPVEAFPVIAQLVDNELTPWVQHRHETKTQEKTQRDRDAQEKIDREKKAAQSQVILAKRQVARATPTVTSATPTPLREQPRKPQYKRADDILKDVGRLVQSSPG
jgi:hypothetical protein